MRRRQFIQLGTGLALRVLAGHRTSARARDHILIVGGGILGASMAYQLSRRGAQVTLLERTAPAAEATGKSFAWLNANYSKQPRHYHLFSRLGVQAFRTLHQEVGPELGARFTGTIEWYTRPERAEELRRMARQQQEWGYPIRVINDGEFTGLEPGVRPGTPATATFSELEGSVDAARATRTLLSRAEAAGAKVIYPCEVVGIEQRPSSGVSLKTTRGAFVGDLVVLACGVDTPKLAAPLGASVSLVRSPGIVVRTVQQPEQVQRVLVTEDTHFRQEIDGRFVLGDDYGPPASEVHRQLDAEPKDFPDQSFATLHGERIRGRAEGYLPSLARTQVASVSLCWRPLPKDGFPIVGFVAQNPGAYVAVTHSGVTLGPLLGELAALELLDGVQVDLLEPYRPGRFSSSRPPPYI